MPRRRLVRALALACGVGLLGACAPYMKDFDSDAPPTARADVVQVTHDIAFRADDQYMSDANGRVLDDFLSSIGLDLRQDHVVVLDRDRASPWAAQRTESVRAYLARRQVAAQAGPAAPEIPAARDTVTVVVERYVLAPLDCPNWTQPLGGNPANSTHRNFGCADAYNMGQMVANKRDLVGGRALGPTDGEVQSLQVQRYRADVMPGGAPYAKPLEKIVTGKP